METTMQGKQQLKADMLEQRRLEAINAVLASPGPLTRFFARLRGECVHDFTDGPYCKYCGNRPPVITRGFWARLFDSRPETDEEYYARQI